MRQKTVFFCTECGNEYPKWMGQCPACGSWNTLVEQAVTAADLSKGTKKTSNGAIRKKPVRLDELNISEEIRFSTGVKELDRVLGGGAVKEP